MKHLSKKLFIGASALSLVACGAQSQVETQVVDAQAAPVEKAAEQGYIKPGASVTMSHNFKGYVQPGSSGSVQVTFTPSVDAGTMRIEASTKDSLSLKSDSTQKAFKLGVSGNHTMDVGFTSQAPGLQRINFVAYTTDAAGQTLARAFSLPIQVGDPALNPPAKSTATIEDMPSGERVVVLQAEETITQGE